MHGVCKAQDIQGRDFFRNNGYSAVCTFTYGNIAASLADGITLTLNLPEPEHGLDLPGGMFHPRLQGIKLK
jgi:hypothetical protein